MFLVEHCWKDINTENFKSNVLSKTYLSKLIMRMFQLDLLLLSGRVEPEAKNSESFDHQ